MPDMEQRARELSASLDNISNIISSCKNEIVAKSANHAAISLVDVIGDAILHEQGTVIILHLPQEYANIFTYLFKSLAFPKPIRHSLRMLQRYAKYLKCKPFIFVDLKEKIVCVCCEI